MQIRALPLMFLAGICLMAAGCSEERYGLLNCPDGLDTFVVYPREEVQQITVIGDETGMAGMSSLYLGSAGGTRSDILLHYDFRSFREDYPNYPDSLFDPANIRSVQLTLNRMGTFRSGPDSVQTPGFIYEIRSLANGFDPRDYVTAPGPAVPLDGEILNPEHSELDDEDDPSFELREEDLIDWVTNRKSIAMVVTAAAGSDSGLVGFASRGTDPYGDPQAPFLLVDFRDRTLNLRINPTDDTSTFDQVAALPPDMAHLQTGLRSYPLLTFDIPALPAESSKYVIFGFRFFADSIDSFWVGSCLEVSQLDSGVPEDMNDPVLAANLEAASTSLFRICPGGLSGEDLDFFTTKEYMDWEPAPPSVMRLVFSFRGPFSRQGPTEETFFTQSTFFGPNGAPDLRPVLLVITCKRGE